MARLLSPDDVPIVLPLKMRLVPIASVMLGSALVTLPLGAQAALWPPVGLIMMICWRLMRNAIWPVWIALPLGLFDDLLSGQPVGSAMALWTAFLIAMDAVDQRVIWREFWLDWVIGAVALALILGLSAFFARAGTPVDVLRLIGPQVAWSIMLLPLAMRAVSALDNWRRRL